MYNPKESKIVTVIGKAECDILAFSLHAMTCEYDKIKDDIYICRTIILGRPDRSDKSHSTYITDVDKYSMRIWSLEKQKDYGRKRGIRQIPYIIDDSPIKYKGFAKFEHSIEELITNMEEYDSNDYDHPYKVIDIILNLPYMIKKNNEADREEGIYASHIFVRDLYDFISFIRNIMDAYKDKYIINFYIINNIVDRCITNGGDGAIPNYWICKKELLPGGMSVMHSSNYIFRIDKSFPNEEIYTASLIKSKYDKVPLTELADVNTINKDKYVFADCTSSKLHKNTKQNKLEMDE